MNIHFTLRPIEPADLESFRTYANNPSIANNLTNGFPHPYTQKAVLAFYDKISKHKPARVLGIDIEGNICGAIGIHLQDDIYEKNAEMGYWLGEPFWGQGIMTQAIQQMVVYGFKHFSIERMYARPFGNNIASQMALKKAGFTLDAILKETFFKNNCFEDEWIFSIRRANTKITYISEK